MLPPKAMGVLRWIAPAGKYTVKDVVSKVEFNGKVNEYPMMQIWPVRSPRPVVEKLAADYPLLTGQRVLDALFP
jgi:V-type H+-transporting ATPase subunit A